MSIRIKKIFQNKNKKLLTFTTGGDPDLETSIKVLEMILDNGADIIKHQTHIIEDEMSFQAKKIIPSNADVSIYEIMKQCALSEVDEKKLMEHIQKRNAIFNLMIQNEYIRVFENLSQWDDWYIKKDNKILLSMMDN